MASCGNGCVAIPAISPGTPGPARSRWARARAKLIRFSGGFTFAEDPAIAAPEARLIWHASLDPGTLVVDAVPARAGDPDAIVPAVLARWLAIAHDLGGEHAVLSDGWHHIRLDLASGSLADGPVVLHYRLAGSVSVRSRVLSLRRLIEFSLTRRFPATLYPADPRIGRWLVALRVQEALLDGASQRQIGAVLFGEARVRAEWEGSSDSLRSRVRRLAAEARRMARGGWRVLMGGG